MQLHCARKEGPRKGPFSFARMTDFANFLAVAAAHRLLTPSEEQALARKTWPVFSKDDTPEAVPPLVDGKHVCGRCEACRARHELVLCNVRLVVSIARYFRGRGLPPEDVIQDGIIGLDRAATKFDPRRSIRFSTYGTLWIRQAIQRSLLGKGSTIHLPSAVASNRAKVHDRIRTGHTQDVLALAEDLGMEPDAVERALNAAEVVTSLDRELSTDEYTHTLLDAIPDPFAEDPIDLIEEDYGALYEVLGRMERGELALIGSDGAPEYDKRTGRRRMSVADHRRVIEMKFGFGGEDPRKPQEIAVEIGRTRSNVMTLLAEATRMLETYLRAQAVLD